ncbi:S-adenosyl-L-methionine-dependent methyltransferase [Cystobasidium minutum MCA 4210]|uniref:S-adenosyl-L-methionine-dependent methyltransferase n=1 Tax=Cystobasidium minutum MCA 4210 TaxID=1397322 RepID=UPI0034CD18FB|eukprot:jgi/Rhomi1/85177/CE85176_359
MAEAGNSDALPSSRLGTKEHWDSVYEREVQTFKEIGDQGEVWFGLESAEEMAEWVVDHYGVSSDSAYPTMLDVGCGNAHLLLLLAESGYAPEQLTGIDYSEASIELSKAIIKGHETEEDFSAIKLETVDVIQDDYSRNGTNQFDLVLDKGTFDAIALCPMPENGTPHPSDIYPSRIASLTKSNGGIFLITSCNFTEEELKKRFLTPQTGFEYLENIPRQTFEFGGSVGQTIVTVAFKKK